MPSRNLSSKFYSMSDNLIVTMAIMYIFLPNVMNANADISLRWKCQQLSAKVPEVVNCPSFDYINDHRNAYNVSVFCRILAYRICMYNFSEIPFLAEMWEEIACRTPFENFDSNSEMGKAIKKSIKRDLRKFCKPLFVKMPDGRTYRFDH